MSQYLSQGLVQNMRMEQRLTPQLIQSMAILQKPLAELETYIHEALQSNAALELAEQQPHPHDNGTLARTGQAQAIQGPGAGFQRLDRYSRAFGVDDEERAPYRRAASSGEPDAKMEALANSASRSIGLHEHLLEQWNWLEFAPHLKAIGDALIQQIEPDGYLRTPLETIAAGLQSNPGIQVMETALCLVQGMDPPGIAARNLIECLNLQLKALPGENGMERALVAHHLEDIARNRLPAIAAATGYSIGEIQEAVRVIRTSLHPRPGLQIGGHAAPVVRPDIVVEYAETGGGLTVRLTRGNLPPLRINEEVAELTRSKSLGRDVRDFAKKHVEAASAIIDAVRFRQSRLLEVGKAIVEKQRDFFDIGPDGLKVYRMSDLAADLQCDPSTISRTVADKYLQSPRGIYPLRYFFTGGTESENGESVGWDRLKTRVKELIGSENATDPYADDQVVELLKKEGLVISRRTVAKYRQQLDIPAARSRRQF